MHPPWPAPAAIAASEDLCTHTQSTSPTHPPLHLRITHHNSSNIEGKRARRIRTNRLCLQPGSRALRGLCWAYPVHTLDGRSLLLRVTLKREVVRRLWEGISARALARLRFGLRNLALGLCLARPQHWLGPAWRVKTRQCLRSYVSSLRKNAGVHARDRLLRCYSARATPLRLKLQERAWCVVVRRRVEQGVV